MQENEPCAEETASRMTLEEVRKWSQKVGGHAKKVWIFVLKARANETF